MYLPYRNKCNHLADLFFVHLEGVFCVVDLHAFAEQFVRCSTTLFQIRRQIIGEKCQILDLLSSEIVCSVVKPCSVFIGPFKGCLKSHLVLIGPFKGCFKPQLVLIGLLKVASNPLGLNWSF